MSGGSMDYFYFQIQSTLCGRMEDRELDELIEDIASLVHDLEWYESGDYGREDYRQSVAKFKQKWFCGDRNERLKKYVDEAISALRNELIALISDGAEVDE